MNFRLLEKIKQVKSHQTDAFLPLLEEAIGERIMSSGFLPLCLSRLFQLHDTAIAIEVSELLRNSIELI